MFRLLEATTATERMDALERFIEFWYGPRKPEYGETAERLRGRELPYPLRRFYRFAGRWPSPEAGDAIGGEFFYTGAGGHHLRCLDRVTAVPDDRVDFFMKYQGDWDGLTLSSGEDPPVWISGRWEWDDENDSPDGKKERTRTKQISDCLSKFLVTHCLMTTVYEYGNSPCSSSDEQLVEWFHRSEGRAVRIWSAEDCDCPNYEGEFFLFHGYVLVHRTQDRHHKFAALRPEGVALIERARTGE